MADARSRIDQIESLIHRDVGRGMDAVFAATKGGLYSAVEALAAADAPRIGVITGFFVPGGEPPAAETDGPAGAALMLRAFRSAGLTCRLATDTICQSACSVALSETGAGDVPVDAVPVGGDVRSVIEAWRREGIDWVIAIERSGPSADGVPRNMRGGDLSDYVAPLGKLFVAEGWRTIGIGDGGNELGMGSVPRALIARHVPHGDVVGCVVPADHLITAGVSHWGAYALLAGLGLLRSDWTSAFRAALNPDLDAAVVAAMLARGPAVDGVLLRQGLSIDAIGMREHALVMEAIRAS